MSDVVAYLESKDIELYPASNGNVRTLCFWHGEEGEAKNGRLYIKADQEDESNGLFFCHVCEARGTFNKIRHHFGDSPDSDRIPQSKKLRILSEAAEYYHENLVKKIDDGYEVVNQEVWDYLTGPTRGLSPEAIMRFKLGVATGQLNDFLLLNEHAREDISATGLVWNTGKDFFERGTVTIPYFVQGTCAQIRGRDLKASKSKYRTPQGQNPMPYNLDALITSSEVIITEGEFDAMLLDDLGFVTVGIPGARAFQEEWARAFADVRKAFICFDNDEAQHTGKEGAEKVASYLGGKARIVELPDPPMGKKKTDITDYFLDMGYKVEDFEVLLRKASSGQLVSVLDAYEMWTAREGDPTIKGLSLGIEQIDTPIRPGLLPGQVLVMLARTGTGKTLIAINVMQRIVKMNPGARILFVSLEQTRNEWFERARRIHGFYNPQLVPGHDLEMSTVDFYKNNLYMIDKNRLSPEDLRTNIRQAEDELAGELDLVVVDYLGYWARAFKGEPYVRTSEAIMTIKEIAKDMQVPIYAPHQVNRGSEPGKRINLNDARESGVIEETADFAFSLLNQMHNPGIEREEATGQVWLEILKSRHGGVGVEAQLQFAPVSLAMVPVPDLVYGNAELIRAKDELQWWKKGTFDYEEVLEKHRSGDRSI